MLGRVLCHFKWVTEEKESSARALREEQNRFTTKGTKSTKESQNETFHTAPEGDIAQQITPFGGSSGSILRVLRALRGKSSLASVLSEPKLAVTTNSCLPRRHRQAKRKGIPRKLVIIAACVILLSVAGLAQTPNLIASADASFDRWSGHFSFSAYETQLREALALYEQALPDIPPAELQTRSHVLNRLAQGYFELGMAYLSDRSKQEEAYSKGKDYALSSLRLDPSFVKAEKESFRTALSSAHDAQAVFWYGNNLGRYLNFHILTAISGGMKDVQASFERALKLDPTYLGGGPGRSLGSFFAQVPAFMGGDKDKAQAALDSAIKIDPSFIENYVDIAEYVAKPAKDWDLFCTEIGIVLLKGSDDTAMAKWPLYNALALKRARDLAAAHPCGN